MELLHQLFLGARKAYLARQLRNRGICLVHGTKIIYDRSIGVMGHGGVLAGERKCLKCEAEAGERAEQVKMDNRERIEAESKALWEEYKNL